MAKMFSKNEQQDDNGIFIQTGTIINIEPSVDSQYPKNVDYVLTLQFTKEEGEPYQKKHFLNGNLMGKDQSLPPHLTFFLTAIGIETLAEEEMNKIVDAFASSEDSRELKDLAIGKDIKILQFVSGTYTNSEGEQKPSYKFWNGQQKGFRNLIPIFSVETENKDILEAFKLKLTDSYKPKYTPEVLDGNFESSEATEYTDEEI